MGREEHSRIRSVGIQHRQWQRILQTTGRPTLTLPLFVALDSKRQLIASYSQLFLSHPTTVRWLENRLWSSACYELRLKKQGVATISASACNRYWTPETPAHVPMDIMMGAQISEYQAPWPIYGLAWSYRKDINLQIAIGSFLDEYSNKVQVLSMNKDKPDWEVVHELAHPYPPTKIGFVPDAQTERTNLMATCGDYLRIWELDDNGVKSTRKLSGNRASEFCAPLTSFDWNQEDRALLGTSSVDTTCTVWNVETQQIKTQLIAHDREVYDFAFASGTDLFASVGADGSVRLFDLRSLEFSTIVYESDDMVPMMRVSWNKNNSYYLATVMMESGKCIILDIRVPQQPIAELEERVDGCKHINSVTWAPLSTNHICTAGESGRAVIWDLSGLPARVNSPLLSFDAGNPIDNMQWNVVAPDWIAIACGNSMKALVV